MAADIMQMPIEQAFGADQRDQTSDDASIDIINSTPDAESAQQHGSTSPFAEHASQGEADKESKAQMHESTPEPRLLLPPQSESPSHPSEQCELERLRASLFDAATEAMHDGASGSPAGDSSGDDEAPLVSMRSQDVSAAAQGSGSAEAPQQQQQQQQSSAQSMLAPRLTIGRQCMSCYSEVIPGSCITLVFHRYTESLVPYYTQPQSTPSLLA